MSNCSDRSDLEGLGLDRKGTEWLLGANDERGLILDGLAELDGKLTTIVVLIELPSRNTRAFDIENLSLASQVQIELT